MDFLICDSQHCIHPFEFNEKSSSLFFNIYTGETVGGKCNVNKSVDIGVQQMNQFKESLPLGFRNKLSTKVVTMAQIKKTEKETGIMVRARKYNTWYHDTYIILNIQKSYLVGGN